MAARHGLTRRGGSLLSRLAGPVLVSLALGALYLILQPSSPDHAAQEFRTALYEQKGLEAWNNLWFAGHHLPGYSILFPWLASLVGARLLGVISTVIASALFAEIAHRHWGDRARLGAIWFAAGTSISLYSGRLTFALGVPIALGAVLCLQRGWRLPAIGFGLLTPLASPVAALFLACGALAYAVAQRKREGLELAIAAGGMAILVALAFPEGGSEPFVFSSFQPALLVALATFIALPKEERVLRFGVAAYALCLLAAFALDTPMGGNATRMGALLLGPLLACALWKQERFVLALLAPLLIYWQWSPVVRDLETVHAEPSVQADYYAPLKDYLRGVTARQQYRVEVLPAEHHWEAAYIPRGIYIARGWERQLDRKLNTLFYEDQLKASAYREWLNDLGVGFVAVPDSPLDYAGELERKLIAKRPAFLETAFHSRDWTVYRVRDPQSLAIGAASLKRLRPHGFSLHADGPGTVLVRVRWTPYWDLERGSGCVEESPNGFTRVTIDRAGPLRVGADFSPLRILSNGPNCNHRDADDGG